MAYIAAIVTGLLYGAVDQYLGSLRPMLLFGSWTPTAAQVSAPWLLLPFLLGATQVRERRAMLLGLVTTQASLAGYFAMTLSPAEGVAPGAAIAGVMPVLYENAVYVVGGLVTGPFYGLLGQRWRVRRWWVSAAFVAGALCLEPLARLAAGRLFEPSAVWVVELTLGATVTAFFAWRRIGHLSGQG
jgi:hypothetical protein